MENECNKDIYVFFFKKIVDRYKNGEPIQDEWDLFVLMDSWLEEYNKQKESV